MTSRDQPGFARLGLELRLQHFWEHQGVHDRSAIVSIPACYRGCEQSIESRLTDDSHG